MVPEEKEMQVDDKSDDLEWVSAMVDGELDDARFSAVAAATGASDEALAAWHSYHVIGDVLRCADLPDCAGDKAFVAQLRARLAAQSPVLPVVVSGDDLAVQAGGQVLSSDSAGRSDHGNRFGRGSANDSSVQWKWLAMAASLAAVAVLGWQVSKPALDPGATLAGAEPTARPVVAVQSAATEQPQVMLRDPRLDELLAAHRQVGGASALPASAGFLRNATFEQPRR